MTTAQLDNSQKSGAQLAAEKEKDTLKQPYSSRWAFWITAVGCSVGFGNIWRFPYLCYLHGGLAFFVPYIAALILVVWPVMLLELGIGQHSQGGNVQAFGSLGRNCRGAGMTVFVVFNVLFYYPLLLTWSILYFINTFSRPMPWSRTDEMAEECALFNGDALGCDYQSRCVWNPERSTCVVDMLQLSQQFFRDHALVHNDLTANEHRQGFTAISGWNVLAVFIAWVGSGVGLVWGGTVLTWIMYISTLIPALILIALVAVTATMQGSWRGIRQYIARFDGSRLGSALPWSHAVSQGLFSVGVAQGTVVAFSSHNPRDQNFSIDGIAILVGDTLFSFLAGFTVFAVAGHLASYLGQELSALPIGGINLAFVTYPVGLNAIPGVGANVLSAFFFLTLWLLGLGTATTLAEAILLVLCESRVAQRIGLKRWHAAFLLCFLFFLPGILLSTNLGYFLLDSIDNYSAVSQMFAGGVEATAGAWIHNFAVATAAIGAWAYWTHFTCWIVGWMLLGILIPHASLGVALGVGLGVPLGGVLVAFLITRHRHQETGESLGFFRRLYYLTIGTVEPLRDSFNRISCAGNCVFFVPFYWSFFLKYTVTGITAYLFGSNISDPSVMYSRPAEADLPYPWYIFLIGQIGPASLVIAGTVLFMLWPRCINPLAPKGIDKMPVLPLDPQNFSIYGRTAGTEVEESKGLVGITTTTADTTGKSFTPSTASKAGLPLGGISSPGGATNASTIGSPTRRRSRMQPKQHIEPVRPDLSDF